MIAPEKVVVASLVRTVATAAQKRQIVAIAIFAFFIVHLRAEPIWSHLGDFFLSLCGHRPVDAATFCMRKSFAKECEERKRSTLHWLRVSSLTIKVRRSYGVNGHIVQRVLLKR